MKIGIIVAMDKELEQLRQVFKDSDVLVQKCGIGKVNAALGAAEMIRSWKPDAIISSGCAGGNGDDIRVQDVVVGAEVCYHDVYCGTAIDDTTVFGQVQGMPARYAADPQLLAKARQLFQSSPSPQGEPEGALRGWGSSLPPQGGQRGWGSSLPPQGGLRGAFGLIVTGDWFVDSKEKMRSIVGNFPEAIAVDMESAAIAQTCYKYGVPFISFRVVSDMPLRDTDAAQYHDFWERIARNSFHVTKAFVDSLMQP